MSDPRETPSYYSERVRKNTMFSPREIVAHEIALSRGPVAAQRTVRLIPKRLSDATGTGTHPKSQSLFKELATGIAEKLIKGATSSYTNGFEPESTRGVGILESTGYSERDLKVAVEIEGNKLARRHGYRVTVELMQEETTKRTVIHLRIIKKS